MRYPPTAADAVVHEFVAHCAQLQRPEAGVCQATPAAVAVVTLAVLCLHLPAAHLAAEASWVGLALTPVTTLAMRQFLSLPAQTERRSPPSWPSCCRHRRSGPLGPAQLGRGQQDVVPGAVDGASGSGSSAAAAAAAHAAASLLCLPGVCLPAWLVSGVCWCLVSRAVYQVLLRRWGRGAIGVGYALLCADVSEGFGVMGRCS